MREKALENYLLNHIPITAPMGIGVVKATSEKVVLRAPFSNNINHKQTVFGGSLYAVATLACWSLIHVNLPPGAQIVIGSGEISYLAPVTTDFTAECCMPEEGAWAQFVQMVEKKGKGRIKLCATIEQEGRLAVDFSGVFVVKMGRS